jgi:hypothetical protein
MITAIVSFLCMLIGLTFGRLMTKAEFYESEAKKRGYKPFHKDSVPPPSREPPPPPPANFSSNVYKPDNQ